MRREVGTGAKNFSEFCSKYGIFGPFFRIFAQFQPVFSDFAGIPRRGSLSESQNGLDTAIFWYKIVC